MLASESVGGNRREAPHRTTCWETRWRTALRLETEGDEEEGRKAWGGSCQRTEGYRVRKGEQPYLTKAEWVHGEGSTLGSAL